MIYITYQDRTDNILVCISIVYGKHCQQKMSVEILCLMSINIQAGG